MKNLLLFLLFAFATAANAQTFDERDLIGTWSTPGLSYPAYSILDIEGITFGDGQNGFVRTERACSGLFINMTYSDYTKERDRMEVYKDNVGIHDYFISNNNKLHIAQSTGRTMHFIIEELTTTTLKISNYEGQSFTFTKVKSSTNIRSLAETRNNKPTTYNLGGQKIEKVSTEGIYIQNGKKTSIK